MPVDRWQPCISSVSVPSTDYKKTQLELLKVMDRESIHTNKLWNMGKAPPNSAGYSTPPRSLTLNFGIRQNRVYKC